MIDLSVIIVTYNSADFIINCLESLKKYTEGINYEIIVVDNNSSDETVEKIKSQISKVKTTTQNISKAWPFGLKLIENRENKGFAAGNNIGIKKAKGRYILLLNPDTELVEKSLKLMISLMDEKPKVGIASCQLLYGDKSLQPTGGFFPTLTRVFLWSTLIDDLPFIQNIFGSYHPHLCRRFYEKERSLDWVTGAFFLIRREVIETIGFLDEDFFLYVEEVEYCLRAKKAGWQVWYSPKTKVIHYVGKSGTKEGMVLREFKGLELLYKKHFHPFQFPVLRTLLFIGSLVRILVFGIMDYNRGKIYVRALRSI